MAKGIAQVTKLRPKNRQQARALEDIRNLSSEAILMLLKALDGAVINHLDQLASRQTTWKVDDRLWPCTTVYSGQDRIR